MAFLGRLLSLVSIPLILLGLWGIARQVHKEQRLSAWSQLVGMLIAVVILVLNLLLLRGASPACVGPVFLLVGFFLGLTWGLTMRLSRREQEIIGRQSILHLFFWGISLTITQALILLAPAGWVKGGLVLMFFSTGTTLGTNINLLARGASLRYRALNQRVTPNQPKPGSLPQ